MAGEFGIADRGPSRSLTIESKSASVSGPASPAHYTADYSSPR